MTRLNRTVRLNHTADNMFELVSGIEQYPDFIRWIQSMKIEGMRETGNVRDCVGRAQVGFKGFSETFATRVVSDATVRTINVSLVDGPLKRLQNRWSFTPRGEATDVEFFVDFEFRNLLLRALAAANFEIAVNRILAAFTAEADRRSGKTSGQISR